ncbi:similar to Saccharomyces cerevisiae YER150W SPI1 GPI-anchored cell wall protein involved in weak acid resistance [Maudiozyma barnettii]|uniref:Similar to Saccharomyces cerevisiae YER150W SPI1 GPI-anchored cell wall protein involved in weak acid resistance n=1 Tax=Maudiozyma barnettii TaxID=61262 RepID=A0A8H2ZK37_9SACH|nr:uncharacterized protein KABA2_10S02376 [Kazachstania barnettii]CAB4256578.1 similar to Saccharomyces cerevisiae YER150W SPI1 GPI-anchored cell wall protein involved in weak acid resistance [Kazachstania barnettii]CAD1785181.1 similar to Saccharomyces cerevisiae YER150W SPI1 GPI-anchored cell wall protein involved in weak acid resistance [Kazachstania barnettii]
MQFTSTLLTSALFATSAMAVISNSSSSAVEDVSSTVVSSIVSSAVAADNETTTDIPVSTTSSIAPIVNSTTSYISSTSAPVVSHPAYNSTELFTVTEVVTAFTTYCPEPTEIITNSKTYTVTGATTLTITDCPCTIVKTTDKQAAEPTTTKVVQVTSSTKAAGSSTHSVIDANAANAMIPSVAGLIGAYLLL